MDNDLIQKEWERAEESIKNTGRPRRLFKADKTKTAMVVIDMENAFLTPGTALEFPAGRGIAASINTLTRACRSAGIPVIWVVSKFRSEVEWGLIATFEPSSPVDTNRRPPVSELLWDADGTKIWTTPAPALRRCSCYVPAARSRST